MLASLVEVVTGWWQAMWSAVAELSPEMVAWLTRWSWWLAAAAVTIVLVALLLRPRGRRRGSLPEMMVSHGELRYMQTAVAQAGDGAKAVNTVPPAGPYRLKLALSNLNSFPVQLVEVAVRAEHGALVAVVSASSVVPPNGAVDVAAELSSLPGVAGRLELYLYAPQLKVKTFRLRMPVVWEPWEERYRAKGLASRSEAVARIASLDLSSQERKRFAALQRRERAAAAFGAARKRAEQWRLRGDEKRKRVEEEHAVRAAERRGGAAANGVKADSEGASNGERERTSASAAKPAVQNNQGGGLLDAEPANQVVPKRGLEFPDEF